MPVAGPTRHSRVLSLALAMLLALTALAPLAAPAAAASPATVKGFVREPGGTPLKGAEVWAISVDEEQGVGPAAASISATDGAYQITLPAGTYVFAATADGHFGGWASGTSFSTARRYTVTAGGTLNGVNLSLEAKRVTALSAEGAAAGPRAATRLLRKAAPRVAGERAIYADATQLLLSDFSTGVAQESVLATWSPEAYDLNLDYAFADRFRIDLASGATTEVSGAYVRSLSCDQDYVAYLVFEYDEVTDEESHYLDIHRVSDLTRVRRIPLADSGSLAPGAVANGRVTLTLANERVLVYDIATGAKVRDVLVADPQTAIYEDVDAVLAGDRLVWTDSIRAWAATLGATPGTSTIADVSGTADRVIGGLTAGAGRVGYAAWTQVGTPADPQYADLEVRAHDFGDDSDVTFLARPAAGPAKPEDIADVSGAVVAWLDPLVQNDDPYDSGWALGEGVWAGDGGAPVRLDTVRHAFNDQIQPVLGGGRIAWLDNGPYDSNEAKWDLMVRNVDGAPGSATVIEPGLYDVGVEVALGTDHIVYTKSAMAGDESTLAELWVCTLGTGAKTRIDRDLDMVTIAVDGDWLVYSSQKGMAPSTLKARSLSGSTVRTIGTSEWSDLPFVVDDGVVYSSDDMGDVWAYDLATGTRRATILDEAALVFGAVDKPYYLGTGGLEDEFWSPIGSLDLGNFETGERFPIDPFEFGWYESKLLSGDIASVGRELLDITSGRYYRLKSTSSWTEIAALDVDTAVTMEWDDDDSVGVKVYDISEIASPTRRVFGPDRVGTSVALSKETAEATCVVIATARNFPDALAGVPLAHALKAPVLLTEPGGLSPAVAAEVQRLGAEKAYVLGSSAAVAASVDTSLTGLGLEVERLQGGNRYQTAAAIAVELKAALGGGPLGRAFLATGRNFPDALAASSVAARMGAPILLTETNVLPTPTRDALVSMGATETVVLGSESVVGTTVFNALPTAGKARIKGGDRYDTARKVAEYGYTKGAIDADSFVFAIGNDFPDALGAGALAAKRGDALLLVNRAYPSALPVAVAELMAAKKADVSRPSIVVGSEAALKLQLQQKISAALP